MKKSLRVFVILMLLVPIFLGTVQNIGARHNDEFPTDDCEEVDQTVRVSAAADSLSFNVTEVRVEMGACVEVFMENKASDTEHDFTVLDADDNELIHMDTPAGETIGHKWQMPNEAMELTFFCEVTGHQEAGMEGDFIIYDPDADEDSPGFTFIPALLAISVAMIVLTRRRLD